MTTLVRFAPFREATVMHTELSRLMNGLFEGTGRTVQSWVPALDAWETEDDLVYAFDLPGISQDKISVEAEDGTLTVSAERIREDSRQDRYQRFERRFGTFTRAVALPQGINTDAIKATVKDGVLEVHVPKPEQVKPKKIEIAVGESHPTLEGNAAA